LPPPVRRVLEITGLLEPLRSGVTVIGPAVPMTRRSEFTELGRVKLSETHVNDTDRNRGDVAIAPVARPSNTPER
jgi:hypothetical protein